MDACPGAPPSRRGFLKQAVAAAISLLLGLIPVAAGLEVLLDPLRRKSGSAGPVRVTTLEALPADGIPRKFSIVAVRQDAWNRATAPIGAVYLRRTADGALQALNVVCPHAGCFVDFVAARSGYFCPCHNSSFRVDGRIENPASPAPRGMDSLPVEVRNGNEIWVEFRNFEAGRAEKIPV
jgi:menaquinol-cytochrome c reductase iron-sulfur subunit